MSATPPPHLPPPNVSLTSKHPRFAIATPSITAERTNKPNMLVQGRPAVCKSVFVADTSLKRIRWFSIITSAYEVIHLLSSVLVSTSFFFFTTLHIDLRQTGEMGY